MTPWIEIGLGTAIGSFIGFTALFIARRLFR